MTAAGDILYLPIASPTRTAVGEFNLSRRQAGAPRNWQHRIYRMPPRERPGAFSYYPNGHAATVLAKGSVVDLYA